MGESYRANTGGDGLSFRGKFRHNAFLTCPFPNDLGRRQFPRCRAGRSGATRHHQSIFLV